VQVVACTLAVCPLIDAPVGRIAVKELGSLVPFLLIALVFWLLLIRPQRKRAAEIDRVQRSVAVGDEVLLGSGFAATITDIPEDGEFLGVELAPGTRVRVARGAIARVLEPAAPHDRPHDSEPPTDLTKS
jgi:preprotein translocase subunit YajC